MEKNILIKNLIELLAKEVNSIQYQEIPDCNGDKEIGFVNRDGDFVSCDGWKMTEVLRRLLDQIYQDMED